MQAVTGDRRPKGQPEEAGGEDGTHVAEGLELAARGAHVLGWRMLVEGCLQTEVVKAIGDAEDDADRQEHAHRGGGVADQQYEGAHGEQAGAGDEGWPGAALADESCGDGRG